MITQLKVEHCWWVSDQHLYTKALCFSISQGIDCLSASIMTKTYNNSLFVLASNKTFASVIFFFVSIKLLFQKIDT